MQDLTERLISAVAIARMGTDTLAGLRRIDAIIERYRAGLISADEAIAAL